MTDHVQADGLIHTLYWNDVFKTMILVKGKTQTEIQERIRLIDEQLTISGFGFLDKVATSHLNYLSSQLPEDERYVEAPRESVEDKARRTLGIGTLTATQAAQFMDGRQYREETTKDFVAKLKLSGLVAVYGASDDLVEFEGAIYDEFGVGQEIILVDGKVLTSDCEDEDCPYFKKLSKRATSRVFGDWTDEGFVASTTIPNAVKFTIMEDDEVYGTGLIFALEDAQ